MEGSGPTNRTINVQGISPMVDEMLLGEIFGAFGQLTSCRIVRDPTGVVGYCDFVDYASASAALAALNGREVLGSELKVTWNVQQAGPKEDTAGHPTVFVGNIGDQIDEYTLFEAFSQYNCSDSRIIRGDDNRCLGYGFVTIRTQEDAKAAVSAMDGTRLMGRPLRVSFAKTPRLSEADGLQAQSTTGNVSKGRVPDVINTNVDEVAKQSSETNTTVHVGNLLGTETEETLRSAFEEFGEIDNMRVPGKNFGFVQYKSHLSAAKAIAGKNGQTPLGFTRPLRCTWASEKKSTPSLPPPPPQGAFGGYPPAPPMGYGYGGPPPPPGFGYGGPPYGGPPGPGYGYGGPGGPGYGAGYGAPPPPPPPGYGGPDDRNRGDRSGGKIERDRDHNRRDQPYSR